MDQNACSSPHLVVWLGKNKESAQERFWSEVLQVTKQEYDMSAIKSIDKYVHLMEDAINLKDVKFFKQYPKMLVAGIKR